MRFFVTLAAAVAVVSAQLRIETPTNLAVCQPALLSWTGGSAPYYPAVIPGGQPAAAALKDFGQQSGTSLTWTVDIAAGTRVSLRITDSTGAVNYAEAVEIRAGSNTNCLNGTGNASAGSSGSAPAASGAATSAAGGSTARPSGSTSAGGSFNPSSAGGNGASTTSRNPSGTAAPANSASPTSAAGPGAKVQAAGVIGGVIAGVLGAFAL